jgi:hypothetical protein
MFGFDTLVLHYRYGLPPDRLRIRALLRSQHDLSYTERVIIHPPHLPDSERLTISFARAEKILWTHDEQEQDQINMWHTRAKFSSWDHLPQSGYHSLLPILETCKTRLSLGPMASIPRPQVAGKQDFSLFREARVQYGFPSSRHPRNRQRCRQHALRSDLLSQAGSFCRSQEQIHGEGEEERISPGQAGAAYSAKDARSHLQDT